MDGETEGGAGSGSAPALDDDDTVMGDTDERSTSTNGGRLITNEIGAETADLAAKFETDAPVAFLKLQMRPVDMTMASLKFMAAAESVRGPSHLIIVMRSDIEVALLKDASPVRASAHFKKCKPGDHWTMGDGVTETSSRYSLLTYWQARNIIITDSDSLKDVVWLVCVDLYRGYEFAAFWTELMSLAEDYRFKRSVGTARPFDKMIVITISPVSLPDNLEDGILSSSSDRSEDLISRPDMWHTFLDFDAVLSRIINEVTGSNYNPSREHNLAPLISICGGDHQDVHRRLDILAEGKDIEVNHLCKGRGLTEETALLTLLPNRVGGPPKFLLLSPDMVHLPYGISYYATHLVVCPTRITKIFDHNTSKVTRSEIPISRDEIFAFANLALDEKTDIWVPPLTHVAGTKYSPSPRPVYPLWDIREGDIETFTLLFHSMTPRLTHWRLDGTCVDDTPATSEINRRLLLMGLVDVLDENVVITTRGKKALEFLDVVEEGDIHMACFLAGHDGKPPIVKKAMARIAAGFVQKRPFWTFGPNARRDGKFDWDAIEKELFGPTKNRAREGKCYIDAGVLARALWEDHINALYPDESGTVNSREATFGTDVIHVTMEQLPCIKARYERILSMIGLEEPVVSNYDFSDGHVFSRDEALAVEFELFTSYVTNCLVQDSSMGESQAKDQTSLRVFRLGSDFADWSLSDGASRTLIYRELAMPARFCSDYTTQDVAFVSDETVGKFVRMHGMTWMRTTYPSRPNAWELPDGPEPSDE